MINIYKALGLERLIEDPIIYEKLIQRAKDDAKYLMPALSSNYYLRSFRDDLEFDYCEDLLGNFKGIDMHVCSNSLTYLEYVNTIDSSNSTHIYKMLPKGSDAAIPIRIMCPDILAYPMAKDKIFGQIAAFCDGELKVISDDEKYKPYITEIEDNNVVIFGKIKTCIKDDFVFEDVSTEYYELVLTATFGDITAIVKADKIAEPGIGDWLYANAVISFDVALPLECDIRSNYARKYYEDAPFSFEFRLGPGYIPSQLNAEKALQKALETKNYSRFFRACLDEVAFIHDGIEELCKNDNITKKLESYSKDFTSCEKMQVISSLNEELLGCNALVLKNSNGESKAFVLSVSDSGYVNCIWILDASDATFGFDNELHAYQAFKHTTCDGSSDQLYDFLSENCEYCSEYSGKTIRGKKSILSHLKNVASRLDDTNQYVSRLVPAAEEIINTGDLPEIFNTKWCSIEYQGNQLAYVVLIKTDDNGIITHIRLSRDGNYLKSFAKEGSSRAIKGVTAQNVKKLIKDYYEGEDSLAAMQRDKEVFEDKDGVFTWKAADKYTRNCFRDLNYVLLDQKIEDDCIAYAFEQNGRQYAVYMYAYGKQPVIPFEADYFTRLKSYDFSKDREIIIIYLQVATDISSSGEMEYKVGYPNNIDKAPELWTLKSVDGKDLVLFYPSNDVITMLYKFVSAYNAQDYDLLNTIINNNAELSVGSGSILNAAIYSHLYKMYQTKGKLKIGYVRNNDLVYCMCPYNDEFYYSFSINRENAEIRTISYLEESAFNGNYQDFLKTEECPENIAENKYPTLSSCEFEVGYFTYKYSIKLNFENGEIRRYILHSLEKEEEAQDVLMVRNTTFTDKIFRNGRIVDHLPNEKVGFMDDEWPQRNQGLKFANGFSLSTAQLYFGSIPLGTFSYKNISEVHTLQDGFDEKGFSLGYFRNLDPENPTYLLNKNTMIAKVLPEKYQNTPIMICPFCGGYSEGRIMVSTLGELDLQYHHSSNGEAGIWGWLDTDFNEIIPPQYIYANNFEDSRAIVCKGEWDINEEGQYWCDDEKWGVIDLNGNEIVSCMFDELWPIDGTTDYYLVHTGGWDDGCNAIYDVARQEIILKLDFDYDNGYMFNECFLDNNAIVFDTHLPGEEKDLISVYDLAEKKYLLHQEENTDRTYNGEKRCVVNKDGKEIIIF